MRNNQWYLNWRCWLLAGGIAAAPSGLAQAVTTTVSFQNGANGYSGTFDRRISTAAANETNGADSAAYFLDGYTKINDERLRLDPGDTLLTSHFAYNTFYGFNTKKYYSSAIHAALVVDTRDNMISAYRGYYLELGWRGAFKFLGNPKSGNMLNTEWRSFHSLSKKNPAHLLAFWVLGNFSPTGQFPYMILPATAYDQRSRSARGYTQGRFRGSDFVYAESEYRFPISGCGGLWSGVLFLNGTTANGAKNDPKLFESIKPGYGLGLRLMLDKRSRSNLSIDYGWGARSSGFYLAVSETF
jgi:outer membrane protein assembly factor BamA